jgi:outer membrane protein, heavy metal efflux system
MDLPVFNRNQGNRRYAQIGMEQSKVHFQQMNLSIENEIALAYQNLANAVDFYNQIEPDYESELDNLLTSYTNNFTSRNISLLEYLDFLDAYLGNKEIILKAGKEVNKKSEELNYTVGLDLIK